MGLDPGLNFVVFGRAPQSLQGPGLALFPAALLLAEALLDLLDPPQVLLLMVFRVLPWEKDVARLCPTYSLRNPPPTRSRTARPLYLRPYTGTPPHHPVSFLTW